MKPNNERARINAHGERTRIDAHGERTRIDAHDEKARIDARREQVCMKAPDEREQMKQRSRPANGNHRNGRARLTALAAAVLLAGCMVGPDYRRPDTTLPNAYPEAGEATSPAQQVQPEWWTLYGDATLNELVSSALTRNTDIQLAVARIEEADATLREAGATLYPQFDLTANPTRSRVSQLTATPFPAGAATLRNNVPISVSTSFELDFWGKLRRANEAARAQALSSRYAKDVTALSLAGLTTQAYFSLRSFDAQIDLTRETLAIREESLEVVRARANGGITSDLEVNQAEGARAEASAQLKDLIRQRALVAHQLGTLTGRLDLTLPAGDLRVLPMPPTPPEGLPSTLLERRPDIRQAEQQLIAANARIGIAKAAMLPTISLTARYGVESRALGTLLDSGANIWSIGVGLTQPIFDAGKLAARKDAEEARQRQSLASYQKSIESAFREVADALVTVRQTGDAEQDLQTRVEAARNARQLAQIRYESGYSAYLEVLDAQRTANDAELAAVRNRQARLAASVDLMKSLGGGWSPYDLIAPSAANAQN